MKIKAGKRKYEAIVYKRGQAGSASLWKEDPGPNWEKVGEAPSSLFKSRVPLIQKVNTGNHWGPIAPLHSLVAEEEGRFTRLLRWWVWKENLVVQQHLIPGPLSVSVLQRNRSIRMCVYRKRDLCKGISSCNCGGLVSPKSDERAGRPELQEGAAGQVQRSCAGYPAGAHVADGVQGNLLVK